MPTRRPGFAVTPHVQPADLLTVRLVGAGPVTVIEAAGDLDMATSPLLIDLAESLLDTRAPSVMVLDLARLRFFCADGIRSLLQIRDAAAARAAHLIVRDPTPAVVRVLTITGMLDAFDIRTGRSDGAAGPPWWDSEGADAELMCRERLAIHEQRLSEQAAAAAERDRQLNV